jgi:hypothetical protein
MTTPKITPLQITQQLSNWQKCFWFWNILHYALGLTTTIGASFTTFVASKYPGFWSVFLPLVVAVCAGALTFLKASSKANAYIAAWRYLNAERICFELDVGYSEVKLAEAHKKGEAIIAKSD